MLRNEGPDGSGGRGLGRLQQTPIARWLEPELFQPFLLSMLACLAISEFVRGALALSLLPTYGHSVLGFPVEWTALALSIQYAVDTALRSPAGWLIDRYGQRPVLTFGFAIILVAVFGMMHVHSVHSLLWCAAAYGIGLSPVWPASMSAISMATPEHKRAAFMGYLNICWLAGAGVGPVVTGLVIFLAPLPRDAAAFWLLLCVAGAGLLLSLTFTGRGNFAGRSTRFAAAAGATGGAAAATGGATAASRGQRAGSASARGGAQFPQTTRIAKLRRMVYWRDIARNVREVAYLFPGMFAQTFAIAALLPILSVYTKVVLHLSGAAYSALLVVGGVLTLSLLIPAGKLVDRLGPQAFLITGLWVAGIGLALYPLHPTAPFTFLAIGLFGICYAFILPAWNLVQDRAIDPDKKGTLWGVFMTVEGIGSATGPYVGGVLWDHVSPAAPFWVSGGMILAMGLLYLIVPPRNRQGTRGTGGGDGSGGSDGQGSGDHHGRGGGAGEGSGRGRGGGGAGEGSGRGRGGDAGEGSGRGRGTGTGDRGTSSRGSDSGDRGGDRAGEVLDAEGSGPAHQ